LASEFFTPDRAPRRERYSRNSLEPMQICQVCGAMLSESPSAFFTSLDDPGLAL
jgi:hypothetical protein